MPKAAPDEAPIVRPAPPALKLSGIAEDATPDGLVRTAILSGFGQLFLAKEGDNVTERYRVVQISSDVVELTDLDGRPHDPAGLEIIRNSELAIRNSFATSIPGPHS